MFVIFNICIFSLFIQGAGECLPYPESGSYCGYSNLASVAASMLLIGKLKLKVFFGAPEEISLSLPSPCT